MISLLKTFFLTGFSFFLIVSPYETKYLGKILFVVGCIGLILFSLITYRHRFYRGFIPPGGLNNFLIFFGISCLISILFGRNPYLSQAVFFDRHLVYFIFFLSGAFLVTGSVRRSYLLIFAFMLSGFIFTIGGVNDYVYYYRIGNKALVERLWWVFGRMIPYYGFPLYLSFFVPFNFVLAFFGKNKWLKLAGLICFILSFSCLIMNASRAAWLSVFLALLFAVFLMVKRAKFAFSIALLLFIFLILVMPDKINRFKTVVSPNQWSDRLPLYKSALAIFKDNPISGVGIGMFKEVLHTPKYELSKDYILPEKLNLHAHNTYLEIAAETGLLGILSFLSIFAVFFWKAVAKIRNPAAGSTKNEQAVFLGLTASVLAALVFAFSTTFIIVGVNNSCYFWLLFGMAVGMLKGEKDKKDRSVW